MEPDQKPAAPDGSRRVQKYNVVCVLEHDAVPPCRRPRVETAPDAAVNRGTAAVAPTHRNDPSGYRAS